MGREPRRINSEDKFGREIGKINSEEKLRKGTGQLKQRRQAYDDSQVKTPKAKLN